MRNLFLLALLFLASCGESPRSQLRFPRKVGNVPPKLFVAGKWQKPPSFQIRELGGSRLVQLQGTGILKIEPEVSGLAEAIQFEKADGFEWLEPRLEGCVLTQVSVATKTAVPFVLSFQLWGWDEVGKNNACEVALRRAEVEKIRFTLRGVKVLETPPVKEVIFELTL
jgi:hypothetical protein